MSRLHAPVSGRGAERDMGREKMIMLKGGKEKERRDIVREE